METYFASEAEFTMVYNGWYMLSGRISESVPVRRTERCYENPANDTPRTPQCNLQFVVCWCLFFKVNSLHVLTNLTVFLSVCTDLNTEHKFILFCGRENLKPPLKAVFMAGFVSSLASFGSSLACEACRCANK